ncbi:MAG: DUF2970 domain-containing protein, partial [Alkalimonas sp.]|nr:DUF2970 domain-containing protein [Alkalimonas sp.]
MGNSSSPTFSQVLKAVIGAFIGVQSEKQRQQDFNAMNPIPYIIAGIVMAVI